MSQSAPPAGAIRALIQHKFTTSDEVNRSNVLDVLYGAGFACLQKIGGEVMSSPYLIVFVEETRL